MLAELYGNEDVAKEAKWRRRGVCLWLSSELSGEGTILYHLPPDVARICGSYL